MKLDRLRYSAAAIAAILVVGCSSMTTVLEGDKIEYKSAGKLPPLEIPPDLTRPTSDDRYAVPDITPKGQATYSAYSNDRATGARSTESLVLPNQDNARIERSGNQRWLVVKGDADAVWPVVKEFWQENGFIVNIENPEAGVMETDWAENRAKLPDIGTARGFFGKILDSIYSTAERDKFRTRLERGAEPGTTEIYVSHRGMEEVYTASEKSDTKWQPRPPDPDLEAEMLRRLMTRFGVQQDRVKSQIAVSAKPAPANATLSRGTDGAGVLSLNDQFDRAWRRVGLALDRVGFTVEDRDRSKGLYFVRYVDPDADNKTAQSKGWLAKLNPFSSSSKQPSKEQFRIQVKDADPVSQVNVLNKDGNQEKSDTANRILTLLYEQLK
jgi:outer membrane protein assembly factor BamC